MKKESDKLEKFIQALELKGLNENEEAVVLTGNYSGGSGYVEWIPCNPNVSNCSTGNGKCTNRTSACHNSTNQDCTNVNFSCGGSTNSGVCMNY